MNKNKYLKYHLVSYTILILLVFTKTGKFQSNVLAYDINETKKVEYKFDFGNGGIAEGYQQVGSNNVYTSENGFGFLGNSPIQSVEREVGGCLNSDFITCTTPFYFIVDLPEGNLGFSKICARFWDRHISCPACKYRLRLLEVAA